jgi:hypothetical protein
MVGVRVEALPREEEIPQRTQVVARQVRPVGIFLADRPDRRRGGEERLDVMVRYHPPERARIGCADGLALIQHGGGSCQQRRIHDVGVPDHPAHIRGGPEYVDGADVVDVTHAPQQRHRVIAVVAHNALRFPCGARGVEHVEGVARRDRHGRHLRRGGHQVLPVPVAALDQVAAQTVSLHDDAVPRFVHAGFDRRVEHRFVVDHPGRFDAAGR